MKVFTLFFITIVSMIISSCKNENNNDFSFSKTYWYGAQYKMWHE